MVKLYLDANGLAPLAQALSGQSRLAGVAAGLRNQMLAAQLDEQMLKNNRDQFGFDNLQSVMAQDTQVPVDPRAATLAFGGNAQDFYKSQRQAFDNDVSRQLGGKVLEAAISGNQGDMNKYIAAYNGKMHSPIRVDGYGQSYNQDTGNVNQTPASVAKIANIDADTKYNYAGVDLRGAQTQNELQQTISEIAKGQGYQIGNQGKLLEIQGKVLDNETNALKLEQLRREGKANNGYGAYKPLSGEARKAMFPDGAGGVDEEAYATFRRWAQLYGVTDEAAFYSRYQNDPQVRQAVNWTPEQTNEAIEKAISLSRPGAGGVATPTVTPYDIQGGVFGEKGSIAYADNMSFYEDRAKALGLPPLSEKASKAQNEQTLTALYNNGAPRAHIDALARRYLGE